MHREGSRWAGDEHPVPDYTLMTSNTEQLVRLRYWIYLILAVADASLDCIPKASPTVVAVYISWVVPTAARHGPS